MNHLAEVDIFKLLVWPKQQLINVESVQFIKI